MGKSTVGHLHCRRLPRHARRARCGVKHEPFLSSSGNATPADVVGGRDDEPGFDRRVHDVPTEGGLEPWPCEHGLPRPSTGRPRTGPCRESTARAADDPGSDVEFAPDATPTFDRSRPLDGILVGAVPIRPHAARVPDGRFAPITTAADYL